MFFYLLFLEKRLTILKKTYEITVRICVCMQKNKNKSIEICNNKTYSYFVMLLGRFGIEEFHKITQIT